MELTRESARTRRLILLAAWIVAAAITVLHTLALNDYITMVGSLGRRGATELETPLQRTLPMVYADTQTWTRHALALLETDAWRIRHTDIDNAPQGREVHWNSAFAWLIAGSGWLRHLVTGEPLPRAVEHALAWINPLLLLTLLAYFAWWTTRRAGVAAGAFVALAMSSHPEFHRGFEPNFVDHHGLLAVSTLGIVLGVLFMGAGWRGPGGGGKPEFHPVSAESARGAVLFSALAGAIGMWISAASVAPTIAVAGAAGLLVTLGFGRGLQRTGAVFDGGLWRLWGRAGGAASLLCYLVEYAPQHLGWRLEVNHPLYALAWWAGGELVAELSERFLRVAPRGRSWWRLVLPVAGVAAAPVTILLGGAAVFVVSDPTLRQLGAMVSEGQSLLQAWRRTGAGVVWQQVPWTAATLLVGGWLLWRASGLARLWLGFTLLVSLVFVAQGIHQIRFFSNVAGPQTAVGVAILVAVGARWGSRWQAMAALAAIGLLCLPLRWQLLAGTRAALQQKEVARLDALQPLYRDLARALRASQPEGGIILLTNPDASTSIGYYGRLKTIGTLYWENLDGMKAAAAMHSAPSFDAARDQLQARQVTHVAVLSEANFLQGFHALAHPTATGEAWKQGIGVQLLRRENVPIWLEEIPYSPPPDNLITDFHAVLYRTRFGEPAAEEAFRAARTLAAAGDGIAAERALDRAIEVSPAMAEYWKFKYELLLARGALDPAFAAVAKAVQHAPGIHPAEIAAAAGDAFYRAQAQGAAVQLYRASLAGRFHRMTASNLGWILATSRDDSLRDGAAALELGRRLVAENPASYDFLSVLAAALAEAREFDEAIEVATRAVAVARGIGQPATVARAEERLRSYQAGRPWRQ